MSEITERQIVCRIADLQQQSGLGFELAVHGETIEGFLVYHRGQIFGYINRCPHTGANLNWQPDQFLDTRKEWIQCSLHGALFRIENGLCIHGPCLGASLIPIAHEIDGENVFLRFHA